MLLEIEYKNKKLERQCTIYKEAVRSYGKDMAVKIEQVIGELEAADSVNFLEKHSISRCHALIGNRKGEFAMDLVHPFRLVFEKKENTIELKRVEMVKVTDIINYH